MKKETIDILCCPSCKGDLELDIKKEEKNNIIEGFFICKKCNVKYPIKDGVPDLLPR